MFCQRITSMHRTPLAHARACYCFIYPRTQNRYLSHTQSCRLSSAPNADTNRRVFKPVAYYDCGPCTIKAWSGKTNVSPCAHLSYLFAEITITQRVEHIQQRHAAAQQHNPDDTCARVTSASLIPYRACGSQSLSEDARHCSES